MASYDWREFQGRNWPERFPTNVRGHTLWRQYLSERPSDLKGLTEEIVKTRQAMAGPSRPCVFVSHRQADATQAVRIAYLACHVGFDYWLDVLDPTLTAGSSAISTSEKAAAATAAVIEMALLNSSHVLAVITPNTKGSQWVPYEYGRVKAPQAVSLQAACWVDRTTSVGLPEYLHLVCRPTNRLTE